MAFHTNFSRYAKKWNSLLTLCGAFLTLVSTAQEPVLPDTEVNDAGYFPTLMEDTLLRGPRDSRSWGMSGAGAVPGPDEGYQVATGLFRYYDTSPDFYGRNADFFRPLNLGLGIFTPHDALMMEDERLQHLSFSMDGNLHLLTRTFEPELAHVKAGPLYFDVLYLEGGVVYSDLNARRLSPLLQRDENDDGWNAYIELGVRGLLRITDSMYISAVGSVMYLPFENEVAFRLGNASNPGMVLRFNYNAMWGEWEILIYDQFRGFSGLDFFVGADSPALDRSGRYSFGFLTDRSNDFYTSNQARFVNTIGFAASRPLFDNQWRLMFGMDHSDFWRTFSFRDHGKRDTLLLAMQYEGSVIPFAPRFSYNYITNDGYESMLHLFQVQLTGRFTENLDWRGMAGYSLTSGDTAERNRFLWNWTLNHTLSRSTRHWVSFGEGYFNSEFVPDTRTARYVRYGIDQRISSQLYMTAFAQYSNRERSSDERFPMRDRFGAGAMLNYNPLDFTRFSALAYYEQGDTGGMDEDTKRWVFRAQLTQQLGHRLTGQIFYQYEEMDSQRSPFTEHYMGVSLRRYF